jgi:sulfocyanin
MTSTQLAAGAALVAATLVAGCAKESARTNASTDTGSASATATTAAALDTGTAAARAAAGPNAATASLPAAEQTNPTTTIAAATTAGAARTPAGGSASGALTTRSAGGAVATPGTAPRTNLSGATSSARGAPAGAQANSQANAQGNAPATTPARGQASTPAAQTSAQAAGQGGAQGGGEVKVNQFMRYDAAAKTVTLDVFAAYNNQQGGFNFNGGSNGSHTITVPVGWTVRMHVVNKDAIPHSAIVINDQHPLPQAPSEPAIPRAYSAHLNDGLPPVNGSDDVVFKASKPGSYLLDCGVPGHGQSGMWVRFNVSSDAQAPAYQM